MNEWVKCIKKTHLPGGFSREELDQFLTIDRSYQILNRSGCLIKIEADNGKIINIYVEDRFQTFSDKFKETVNQD